MLSRIRTFVRTVDGPDIVFDDEPKMPLLNNLATHINDCKKKDLLESNEDSIETEPKTETFNLRKSAEMLKEYFKKGELNPAAIITQKGFYRLFAAWILDESLPWTTGEAPTLQILFKYLKVNYHLPTDTTVRNQLAHIFSELHGKIVREFSVPS